MNSNRSDNSQQELIDSGNESISLMLDVEEQLAVHEAVHDFDASDDPTFAGRRLRLMKQTASDLHIDALRNGKRAQAHKRKQRADYAAEIFEAEGRIVRNYQKATPERRREQKKKSKANRSPEQIERERIADRLRKQAMRDAERLSIEQQRRVIEEGAEF